jgi:hypothetical protein
MARLRLKALKAANIQPAAAKKAITANKTDRVCGDMRQL